MEKFIEKSVWRLSRQTPFLTCKGKTKGKTPCKSARKEPVTLAVTGFFLWSEWRDSNSRPHGPEPLRDVPQQRHKGNLKLSSKHAESLDTSMFFHFYYTTLRRGRNDYLSVPKKKSAQILKSVRFLCVKRKGATSRSFSIHYFPI